MTSPNDDDEVPFSDFRNGDEDEHGTDSGSSGRRAGDDRSGFDARPGSGGDPLADLGSLMGEARRIFGMVQERFVEPVAEKYPEVAEHLTAAGSEIVSAYRAVLRGREQQWNEPGDSERITIEQLDSDESDEHRGDDDGDARGGGGSDH